MTACAADRNTLHYGSREVREHDVAAATTIYFGSLVCLDSLGNAVPAANTAGLKLAGVSRGDVRNGTSTIVNAGSAGAKKVEVITRRCHKFVSSGLTKADIGKPMFITDDQTVTLTPGYVFAGILKDIDGATGAIIDIEPATREPGKHSGKLFTLHAFRASTVGATLVAVRDGIEVPRAFRVLAGFADAKTAPGGAYTCAIGITDGTTPKTFNISASGTHGEDKAIDQIYAGNVDIDITAQDSNGSAATADIDITFICELL